jgi:serpin B
MAEELANSTRAFALDIFHTLRKQEQGNLFFSPMSITSALGMVFAGARSSTSDEMTKVMHLSKDKEAVHKGFKKLLGSLQGGENVVLETANRVYVQDGYKILDEYLNNLKENYLSGVENADFGDDKHRVKINGWVEDQTRQKIKDLLPPIIDCLDKTGLGERYLLQGELGV